VTTCAHRILAICLDETNRSRTARSFITEVLVITALFGGEHYHAESEHPLLGPMPLVLPLVEWIQ